MYKGLGPSLGSTPAMSVSRLLPWAIVCQPVSAATREKGHQTSRVGPPGAHLGSSASVEWREQNDLFASISGRQGIGYFSKGFGVQFNLTFKKTEMCGPLRNVFIKMIEIETS